MNNEQKPMLGNDWGFALLPCHFSEAITSHCNYDYKYEKIDNETDNYGRYEENI